MPRSTKTRVLLFDSSEQVRNIFKRVGEKHGVEVHVAGSVNELHEINQREKPHVVLVETPLELKVELQKDEATPSGVKAKPYAVVSGNQYPLDIARQILERRGVRVALTGVKDWVVSSSQVRSFLREKPERTLFLDNGRDLYDSFFRITLPQLIPQRRPRKAR